MRKKACSDILPLFQATSCSNPRDILPMWDALLHQKSYPAVRYLEAIPLENLKRAGLFFLEIIHRRAPTRRVRCFVRQAMVACLTRNVAPTLAQGGPVRSVLSYQSKRELVQQMAPHYHEASRARKILMRDEFVAITGYVRTYAIQLLNHPGEPKPRSQQARLPHYGPEVQQALLRSMDSGQSDVCQAADSVPTHSRRST